MALGFVLVHVSPSREYEVYEKLTKIPEVFELSPLFGEYDFIAKVEAEDYENLGNIIVSKIRSIEGVVDTKTLTGTK